MQRFVTFTLSQKVVFNLIFVLLMVIGAFTLLRMPVERYPNIQFGKMFVNIYLPGASPEEVETLITRKVEESLEDLEDVEYVRSSSYRERSSIVIKFLDDSDYERRFDDVRLKVLSGVGELPDRTEPPVFNFLDVNDWFPTISVNVAGDHANTTLSLIAEEVKIALAQIAGVKEVKVSGDYTREFHIILAEEKLRRFGLTFMDVAAALRTANVALPAGHAKTELGEFVVKVDEQFTGRDDLFSAVIRRDGDGALVRLGDLAQDGYFSYLDPFIMASVNGENCVTLQILKHASGNAINEVSLFAFVLVSGIIVDDAIVVVENIYRHMQTGKSLVESVTVGTAEVFLPVVSATLTTVVAFLPMLIMTGMLGDFFAIIPKTIAFALTASLLECLLILPCHYMDFGPRPNSVTVGQYQRIGETRRISAAGEKRIMRLVRWLFHRSIVLAMRYRKSCLGLLGLLFIVAIAIFIGSLQGRTNLLRIQFFPDNYSLFYAELTGPAGTSIETTHELVKEMAVRIAESGAGQAESALGFAGYYINEDFSPQYGNNLGYIAVTLPSSAKRHFADFPENDVIVHLEAVRKLLQPLVPQGFGLSVRPEKDGPPSGKDINIRVLGSDSESVASLAKVLGVFLREDPQISPWLVDLADDQGREARVFRIKIDAERAAEWGFSVADVAGLAASALQGQIVGEMKLPEEMIDIRLKTEHDSIMPMVAALDMLLVDSPQGSLRLGDLCRPEFSLEPGYLNRFQRQRAITLTANLATGAPLTSAMVVKSVSQFYAKMRSDYSGASLNFAGEYESTQKSFTSLAYAFVIAIVVIYLVLAAQFQSYLQPLIIIAAVIFALTGVVYGTMLSRTLFTVNSFVAVIGVTGVVVNDSLVLVEFINKCYRLGMQRRHALLRATHLRLRPILLTTLTTTLGLLPMALGIPEYSIIWGSMAMTFVTGLCTATFLTIIIIPLLWDISEKRRERR